MRSLKEYLTDRRLTRLEGDLKMLNNRLQFNPLKLTAKIGEESITKFSDKIAEYKVWSSGDAVKIREYYFKNYGDYDSLHYFWRNAPATSLKKHTGIPALISHKMGYILFGNGIDIDVLAYDEAGNKSDEVTAYIREELLTLYSKLEMEQKLQDGATTESWGGEVFYKLSVDNTLSDYPILEVADITRGRVYKDRGITKEIRFPTYYKKKDQNYRLDEVYSTTENGDACIYYKLYKLNVVDNKEEEIPLSTIPETAYIDEEVKVFEGIKGLLAFAKPNKKSLMFTDSDYGASDYEGAIDSFDAMDEAYSTIFKELRTNRTVRYIPKDMIPKTPDGRFILNDNFTDAYVQVESDIDQNSKSEITFSIIPDKTESHKAKFLTALTTALNKAGLSPYAIGITGLESVNASAESQQERNKVTLETRKAKMEVWKPFIEEMLIKILQLNDWMVRNKLVDQPAYKDNNIKWENIEVQVSFGDYIVETENNIITSVANQMSAGVISTETALKEIHPDWNDEQILEEVNRIRYEKGMALDTPDSLPELTGIVEEDGNEQEQQ